MEQCKRHFKPLLKHVGSRRIVVANVDIISENPWHYLSVRSNFDRLLDLVFSRKVHGVIIGPHARLGQSSGLFRWTA